MKEIIREGYFSDDRFENNQAVKEVLNSPALKKLGEKYDFNVRLYHENVTYAMSWANYHVCNLYLDPVYTEPAKKLPVKPYLHLIHCTDVLPYGLTNYNYFEDFVREIKNLKYKDIIKMLNYFK